MTEYRPPKAPVGLRAQGRRLWLAVTGSFECRPDELVVLDKASRLADHAAVLGCNLILGDGITDGVLLVEQLEARLSWVLSTDLYRRALERLALYVLTHVRESVTESEYAVAGSQSQRIEVFKLIELYTGLAGDDTFSNPMTQLGTLLAW